MIQYNSLISKQHPSHWKVVRNKAFLSATGEIVGKRANEYTLLSLTTNGVIERDVESGKGKFPKDFDNYQVVKPNELVFCLFDIDETPRTVGLVKKEGMLTGAYTALKVNKSLASPQFVYYYYLAVDNTKGLRPYYSGLRKTVRADKFLQIYIPLPPLIEQEKIVDYLEGKTSKIDAYVAEKEKEILLLQELKQKTIADAVTKGLNPDVKMTDYSSLITSSHPNHWKNLRNKTFLSLTGEKVGNRASEFELLSLTTRGVIVRDLISGKGKFPKDFDTYQFVRKDELVFCLFDIDETPRTVGLVDTEGMLTGAYTAFKVNTEIALPEYVYNYFLCVDNIKALKPYYSGLRKTVRADKFLQIYIPLPPLSEQCTIVAYIDEKCKKIDRLMTELQAEIDYMKEYKQRLIADCVTGQVNVQNETI